MPQRSMDRARLPDAMPEGELIRLSFRRCAGFALAAFGATVMAAHADRLTGA